MALATLTANVAVRFATAFVPFVHEPSANDNDDDDDEFDEAVDEEGRVEPNWVTASTPADQPISELAKSPRPPYM